MSDHLIPASESGHGPEGMARQLLERPKRTLCFCHGTRASTVIRFLEESQTVRVRDVARHCSAGDCCVSCRLVIGEMIRILRGVEPDHDPD